MAVVTLLFLLSYSAWLVEAQNATQCPPVSGQPGCVCQHPDGIIDLTKIANRNGKPRYSLRHFNGQTLQPCESVDNTLYLSLSHNHNAVPVQ